MSVFASDPWDFRPTKMNEGAIHRIQGPRKSYHQTGVDTASPYFDRAALMADESRRAIEFFSTVIGVDWLTLEFRIVNHGTELPGTEIWRWEIWIR